MYRPLFHNIKILKLSDNVKKFTVAIPIYELIYKRRFKKKEHQMLEMKSITKSDLF